MMKNTIKYFLALIGLEYRRGTATLFNRLSKFNIPREEWEMRQGSFYLKALDVSVTDVTSPLILQYKIAKSIYKIGGGRFFYDQENHLRLSIDGINFFIHFADELYVINEVFVSREYNFRTMDEIVVIDIGLNIGATSLFFASQKNVKHVYSYELFGPTYEVAQRNLSINDASKIASYNVGLGKNTREMTLSYSPANKARMGLFGLPVSEQFPDAREVTVSVKDVAEEVIKIGQLQPGVKKVCKMDCEGAEFEILERLFQSKAADLIDVFIIEWHTTDELNIEVQFLQNGFDVIMPTSDNPHTGLLYAFKK